MLLPHHKAIHWNIFIETNFEQIMFPTLSPTMNDSKDFSFGLCVGWEGEDCFAMWYIVIAY